MNIIMLPQINAIATESSIPDIIAIAFDVFMKCERSVNARVSLLPIAIRDTATAAPKSSNTRETVVEVGSPMVLKRYRSITSVSITVRNTIIISWNVNIAGLNTPLLATSIIPIEKIAHISIPIVATPSIT